MLDRVNDKLNVSFYSKYAEAECIEVGDKCFHPQLGLYDKSGNKKKLVEERPNDFKLKTFNSLDVNLINCDKNYYFDIFCGKEKKIKYDPIK